MRPTAWEAKPRAGRSTARALPWDRVEPARIPGRRPQALRPGELFTFEELGPAGPDEPDAPRDGRCAWADPEELLAR